MALQWLRQYDDLQQYRVGATTIDGNGTGSPTFGSGNSSSPSVLDVAGSPRTITVNKTGGTTTFNGAVFEDSMVGGNAVTFHGSGNINFNNLGATGAFAGIDLSGTGVYTFGGTAAPSFSNSITLNSGTLSIGNAASVGANGTLTLTGGTFQAIGVSFAMPMAFVGPGTITLDNTGQINNTYPLTSGSETISGSPTIDWERPGDSTLVFSSVVKLQSDVTFTGSGNIRLKGGLDLQGADRTITENSANLVQSLYLVGQIGSTVGTDVHTLTLAGSGKGDSNGANLVGALADLPGATPVVIEVDSTTGGIYNFGATLHSFGGANTYSGGTVLANGTLIFGTNQNLSGSSPASSILNGPIGTGPLTVTGGIMTGGQKLSNAATFSGTIQNGAIISSSTLTFDPTQLLAPPTVQISGPTTFINMESLNFTGVLGGINSPSLTVKGPGNFILTNNLGGAANSFGDVTIGDNEPTGSFGGKVLIVGNSDANGQASLGNGAYTIDFGGVLNMLNNSTNLDPSNDITVNMGGVVEFKGTSTPFGTIVLASGATLNANSGGPLNLTAGPAVGQTSFPTSGALLLLASQNISVTGAYPTPTGTLAIGGLLTGSATFSTTQPTTISTPTTLSLSAGGGGSVSFGGMELDADLTVAGNGNTGFTGMVPANGSNLGTISGGTSDLTVAMAPTGLVQVVVGNGWMNTNIDSGTLQIYNFGSSLGGGVATIDGGALRLNTSSLPSTQVINVGDNGGALEAVGSQTYAGSLSGVAAHGFANGQWRQSDAYRRQHGVHRRLHFGGGRQSGHDFLLRRNSFHFVGREWNDRRSRRDRFRRQRRQHRLVCQCESFCDGFERDL